MRPARALAVVVAALLAAPFGLARGADDPVDALRRALKQQSPEARAEAAKTAQRSMRGLPEEARRRAALALRDAWKGEADPAARAEIVRALAALDEPTAWVATLVATLSDRDEAVRAAGRDAVLVAGAGCVTAATTLLAEDDDPTFRASLCLLLGRRRRPDAVAPLLAALSDPHPRVSTAAAEGLEAVTGQALGYEPAAWKAWVEASRAAPPPADPRAPPVTREPEARKPEPPPPPPRGLVPDFHGIPITAKDVVFVIDVSGSIGATGFESAKGATVRAMERLGSDVHVAALFFDEVVHPWHPETVLATPENKADLAKFVRGIPRGKHTDVMTPLNAGLQIVRNRVEARRQAKETAIPRVQMFVVSDGLENARATPGEAVGEKLDRIDFSQAVVHAIVVGGRDNGLMAALARRGGGRYVVLP